MEPENKPEQGELEQPEFVPFDGFAKSLIDVRKKWVSSTRLVSLTSTLTDIVQANPFRIYLRFQALDALTSAQLYTDGMNTAQTGFIIVGVGFYMEFFPAKDGPLATQRWLGISGGGVDIIVTETFYRGNTDQQKG